MKKFRLAKLPVILVLAFTLLSSSLSAGTVRTWRFPGCYGFSWPWWGWWWGTTFTAESSVYFLNSKVLYNRHDHCFQATSFAANSCAAAWATIGYWGSGSSTWSATWPWWCWFYSAGNGYTAPADEPENSLGSSRTEGAENIVYDPDAGTAGQIAINNLDVTLRSYAGSEYGAMYRITVWEGRDTEEDHEDCGPDHTDQETISANKIVWDAGVYINNGQMVFTGNFGSNDFSSNVEDYTFVNSQTQEELEGDALIVRSAAGLNKVIDVATLISNLEANPGPYDGDPADIELNRLFVTIDAHTGFGSYSDPYGYNPDFGSRGGATALSRNAAKATGFNVFPNPVDKVLNISVKGIAAGAQIRIYDSKGTLVKTAQAASGANTTSVDVDNLPNGIYRVVYAIDGMIYSKSFVKQ